MKVRVCSSLAGSASASPALDITLLPSMLIPSPAVYVAPPPVPSLSAAGFQVLPSHFKTCPAAAPCGARSSGLAAAPSPTNLGLVLTAPPPPVATLSFAGVQFVPFHFSTCPLAAVCCASPSGFPVVPSPFRVLSRSTTCAPQSSAEPPPAKPLKSTLLPRSILNVLSVLL